MNWLILLSKYASCYFHAVKQISITSKAETGVRGLGGESCPPFCSLTLSVRCELNQVKLALNHCSDQQNCEHNPKQ